MKVKFRYWKKSIIALFPETYNEGIVDSYQKIGQHGEADYGYIMITSRPALPDEYDSLKRELESIGYEIEVTNAPIRFR